MTIDPNDLLLPQSKSWYASRTVLGALLVVVSQLVALAGITIDAAALTEVALDAVGLAGGLLALWGRVRATVRIA